MSRMVEFAGVYTENEIPLYVTYICRVENLDMLAYCPAHERTEMQRGGAAKKVQMNEVWNVHLKNGERIPIDRDTHNELKAIMEQRNA